MGKLHGQYSVLILVILFAVAGCLRSASEGEPDVPEPQILSSPTPSPTPVPTQTPLLLPTAKPTEVPTLSESVILPTDTSPIFATPTEFPIQSVQQTDVTLDPRLAEATRIVVSATQWALDQTATAIGPRVELPTFTPTFDPFAVSTLPVPTVPGSDCVHEVVVGENLYRLSIRYGVLVANIAAASGVTDFDRISVGQKLTIPGCGTTGAVPPPTSTPTPSARATATPGGVVSVGTPIPATGGRQHLIRQGETLLEISLLYGVPVDVIAAANGITDYDRIDFNEYLTIPNYP